MADKKKVEAKDEVMPVIAVDHPVEFMTGTWSGVPHYRCNLCQFDTFDGMGILRHLVDKHESEAALEAIVRIEEEERERILAKEAKNAKNHIN